MRPAANAQMHKVRRVLQPTLAVSRPAAAFTLIELMVAVTVLLVVILATAQIFSTASMVTGTGQALANVMQEAAVIERNMRRDFARMSPQGFFAIRQVAVPNDINLSATGRLLNPMLPPEAMIRFDQLVFFANGVESQQAARTSQGTNIRGQELSARVYYGHTFTLPNGKPFTVTTGNQGNAHDPAGDVYPWHAGNVDMVDTYFATISQASGSIFSATPSDTIDATQPEARKWLLARQIALLADDDGTNPDSNSKTVYHDDNLTARSIFRMGTNTDPFGWSNEIRNGRVDGAASRLDEIWWYIREYVNDPGPENWGDHQVTISDRLIYYPRAERIAPSAHRVDQALTNHVIGSAVSSFIVEWTWEDGVGEVRKDNGEVEYDGFYINDFDENYFQPEQSWFGLNASDFCERCEDRGVGFYQSDYQVRANYTPAETIFPNLANTTNNIEWWDNTGQTFGDDRIRVYEAIFGYNRNRPIAPDPSTTDYDVQPYPELAYTPWPSAVRITMVLHDPQGRLEHGREFQFVIDLPKRVR